MRIRLPSFHAACRLAFGAALLAAANGVVAAPTVYLEEMTFSELRSRIAAGETTVLVPIGGTEQSGPFIALGKHNTRARLLAGRIAEQLGHAVVAPVIAYVPEGSIAPPAGHMRFAGTISVPEPVFEGVLEATARSFKAHGFKEVFFLGDHGGYQASESRVAAKLDREWARDLACRVHALSAYYEAADAGFAQALRARGFPEAEIGAHAGLADTSLTLALDPSLVRADALARAADAAHAEGVRGDPRRASADLGRAGVDRIVAASVAAVQAAERAER